MTRPATAPSLTLISLVVPVHNETGSIEPFLARTRPVMDGVMQPLSAELTYEILFVDDGSTDATMDELQAARATDPRIRIVSLSRNWRRDWSTPPARP